MSVARRVSRGRTLALLLPVLLLVATTASRAPDFCPMGCSCDDNTLVVTCVETSLDVIPITLNPAIQRLVLKQNRIKTVHAAFQFYGELHYVDLSSNHLLSIPAGSFDAQRKLQELRLDNNKLSNVTARTFQVSGRVPPRPSTSLWRPLQRRVSAPQGLRALTALSLRRNFLEALGERQFSMLPLLEELDLGENRIGRIDPLAFDLLPALRVLYLDDNQLRVVPTVAFAQLASLAELRVGLNAFHSLNDDAFRSVRLPLSSTLRHGPGSPHPRLSSPRGLSRLTSLDLSGAGLVNVSENAFRGLTGLRILSLADNKFRAVPTQQLAALARLEELSVGQNDFYVIEPNAFQVSLGLGKPSLNK